MPRAALLLVPLLLAGGAAAAPAASGPAAAGAPDAAAAAPTAAAANATVLDGFLAGLTSLRASFTQTVTDAHGATIDSGSGSLVLQRPGRFRWDYEPRAGAADGTAGASAGEAGAGEAAAGADDDHEPSGQLLVADGHNLWFYDRELAQVTVKPLQAGLSSTPIMLLTGAAEDLRRHFEVMSAGTQDGLSWVQVTPRGGEADFTDARLGFRGGTLVRMLFHDMLDRTVQLDFSDSRRNARIDPSTFEFRVPSGVDVIGAPQGAGNP